MPSQAANPREYIGLANHLAEVSGPIIRGYFRSPAGLTDKADSSPVTLADKEAEAAMRAIIEAECPDHGILGEEEGGLREDADWLWVLDPIDGTKAFATGKHTFGTLISLTYLGEPVLGIIDQPILRERWLGVQGQPTTLNGEPAGVRTCANLGDAWLYSTSPYMFEGRDEAPFKTLAAGAKHSLFGTDCYGYALVASGYVDMVCEAKLSPWDYCALVPVVEGAGGVISDWQGAGLTIDSDGRVLAAGDERCHAQALVALNS